MLHIINKKKYYANDNEFKKKELQDYSTLKILEDVGLFERLISLFIEFKNCNINNLCFLNTTHGGFLPIECSNFFINITLINTHIDSIENINKNIKNYDINNIKLLDNFEYNTNSLIFNNNDDIDYSFLNKHRENIYISKFNLSIINNKIFNYIFKLKNTDYFIYLNENNILQFKKIFTYYFENDNDSILNYDNLIHLCVMVKNGGPQFEEMLMQNMDNIDRWTILDTGSSDNTIDIINKVLVGRKQGQLFQEPFINFKDSRNRCLELAGKTCKYIIMLDDTYVIEGNLRNFLNEVRGDQMSDSFSMFIKSDDSEYGSNRIIKSETNLKYIYKIHEVISNKDNFCVMIPKNVATINDRRFFYMEDRTRERAKLDLKLLNEELEENPMEPRTYYYLAQTYNLLENYELAYHFYLKRCEFTNSGFIQERINAAFEAARIANFRLNKSWNCCLKLYENAFKIDETRPESQYFIGIHYYLENNYKKAYHYLKKGFEIGYPIDSQYSLKPTISFHFLPKFLSSVCYEAKDYKLGEAAAELYLKNNTPSSESYQEVLSWYNIYKNINLCEVRKKPLIPKKQICCFIADGGFEPWSGKNILTTGVGGSETYIIEMARYIQLSGYYDVVVFCNCLEEEIFENVSYKPLSLMHSYIYSNYIQTCIVSRFSEYLPAVFNGWTENVYLVVHDLTPSGIVIPLDIKLKNIFCLTEWHVDYLNKIFPSIAHLTKPFYYGIDFASFNVLKVNKIPYKFIYSSFPNRGLLSLLKMWPKIYEKQPLATLDIYCNLNGKWVNELHHEQISDIKNMLYEYSKTDNNLGIHCHGWVDKKTLANSWASADIWFYPCTFMETFCLTALEAALSKTLVITNDLAGLQNTVSDRGVIISGNPIELEWQTKALDKIFYFMEPKNNDEKNKLIEKNYRWACSLSWENQSQKLLHQYILPNDKLEYKQMYNWTNDLPNKEEKKEFLNIIKYFNNSISKVNKKPIILEIGTYTGISLINIVKLIPNSIGYSIDTWKDCNDTKNVEKNYFEYIESLEVEKSFYKNIENENLQDRIHAIKGNSKDVLLDILKTKNLTFDFIYIDGSHKCIDCYLDMFFSWKLLNIGGILAVDDYLYHIEDKIESPFEAINKFLNENKGNYNLLYSGYRIFLEKINS